MVFIWFILIAVITVFTAIKLSTYADTIGEKTALGGMLVGTLLLAGATSLPEVTTSLSAIILDTPDIAVGNVFGSNLFNLFILAAFDLLFRREQLLIGAEKSHFYSAAIGLLLSSVAFIALTIRIDYSILGIGVDTWLLIGIYGLGVTLLSRLQRNEPATHSEWLLEHAATTERSSISLKHAVIGFLVAALVIMVAGTFLTIYGEEIAVVTGLGSSFVGSFLIAATTSLPEAVSVYVALRLRNFNLAIGAILGSNMFNILILGASDIFYRQGSLLASVSTVHQITAAAVAILSAIVLYSLARKTNQTKVAYIMPSAILVILYFVSSYLIFIQ